MANFELYFRDLNPDAQKQLLIAAGIDNEKEANWDMLPIASLDFGDGETTPSKKEI